LKVLETSEDSFIKGKTVPRVKLLGELFGKGGDSAKLAEKIRDNFTAKNESDYSDDSHKDNLDKLKRLLEELKEYKEGKKKEVYNGLSQESKTTLDNLITDLGSKVSAMEKKSKESSNTEGSGKGDSF